MFKFENNFLETFCWGMLLNFNKIPIQLMCDDAHKITFQYCASVLALALKNGQKLNWCLTSLNGS